MTGKCALCKTESGALRMPPVGYIGDALCPDCYAKEMNATRRRAIGTCSKCGCESTVLNEGGICPICRATSAVDSMQTHTAKLLKAGERIAADLGCTPQQGQSIIGSALQKLTPDELATVTAEARSQQDARFEREYLGDGVYAYFNGYDVTTETERGSTMHYIGWEPETLRALLAFASKHYKSIG